MTQRQLERVDSGVSLSVDALTQDTCSSPHLIRIRGRGKRSQLEPDFEYVEDMRWPYKIPWGKLKDYTCRTLVPSTAAHVSQCPPADAEWSLELLAYRIGGELFDVYEALLLAREGEGGAKASMPPRRVVAKVCDVVDLNRAEREGVRVMMEREARLMNTALQPLQGTAVPRFYGAFKVFDPSGYNGAKWPLLVSIWEDCGYLATPDRKYWRISDMLDEDKTALSAVVAAVHGCGVVHGHIHPEHVLRRNAETANNEMEESEGHLAAHGLCLVDFTHATLGPLEEIAEEKQILDRRLAMKVAHF